MDHREQCLHLGAKELFQKPLDFPKMQSALDKAMREPRRERRSEPRIRLKAVVKLRGTAENGKEFELLTTTEDVKQRRIPLPLRDPAAAGLDH